MTDLTLPPSRREWAKACEDRASVEKIAGDMEFGPPDQKTGEQFKNVLSRLEPGERCVAVPAHACAVVFLFRKEAN